MRRVGGACIAIVLHVYKWIDDLKQELHHVMQTAGALNLAPPIRTGQGLSQTIKKVADWKALH